MCNIGKIDKIIRLVLGLIIVTWGAITMNFWGIIGIALIGTSLMSFCPLYALLKVNTGCKKG